MPNLPAAGRVVAVNISAGGIPKQPLSAGTIRKSGLDGDQHAHTKHDRPDRAVSLWDTEIMHDLRAEGFPITPGATGENLSLEGLRVQQLPPGTLLMVGEAVIRLEQPRKPCYVLDAIDPRLKDEIVGRCGFMASVVEEGTVRPGDVAQVIVQLQRTKGTFSRKAEGPLCLPPPLFALNPRPHTRFER